MIFVDAPGFRPTAWQAPSPMSPTPIAAPNAARPTCMLPYNEPVICVSFLCLCTERRTRARRLETNPESAVRDLSWLLVVVLTNQQRKHRRQQHEYQGLNET